MTTASSRLRCAIYTRKSTEEGLDQAFNSLDAQREACEAYIVSQASLGWKVIPEFYDDGGISGGTMERPALKRLLRDIQDRKIDVVVVYKIDRLTRALMDFSRIVEIFDGHGVSFVSVTQQFNTTTSMGRLTLNVLLSFAQFEREVTAERIRDKVAASKKKGMWMGGIVPLGYRVVDRKLVIDEQEAETVRWIFQRYQDLRSIRDLAGEARNAGLYRNETRKAVSVPFARGNLHHLLANPVYVGKVRHKGNVYDGEHAALIDNATFARVQQLLSQQAPNRRAATNNPDRHLLAGLLQDEDGQVLTTTHAQNHGKRYRYYVSKQINATSTTTWRLASTVIEPIVERQIKTILADKPQLARWIELYSATRDLPAMLQSVDALAERYERSDLQEKQQILRTIFKRITMRSDAIAFDIAADGLAELIIGNTNPQTIAAAAPTDDTADAVINAITITVPIQMKRRGVENRIVLQEQAAQQSQKDPMLIALIARAHLYLDALTDGSGRAPTAIADQFGVDAPEISRTLPLAFLSPKIVEAILTGRQPADLTVARLSRMLDMPMLWTEQQSLLNT